MRGNVKQKPTTLAKFMRQKQQRDKKETPDLPNPKRWFDKAQSIMADFEHEKRRTAFMGKLYSLFDKLSERWLEDNPGELGLDEDCRIVADAYKKMLEINKHGGWVELPKHLEAKFLPRDECLIETFCRR
jgi:hypothetical protein